MLLHVQELNKPFSQAPHLVFLFCLYIAVGVAYYHGADHFSFFNALYFSVITFTTVG